MNCILSAGIVSPDGPQGQVQGWGRGGGGGREGGTPGALKGGGGGP